MNDCLFCKMANKEIIPDIVYEDEDILAFKDIAPRAKVHILIIPKKHISCLADVEKTDVVLIGKINLVAAAIAKDLGLAQTGYRLLTNCGHDSGQEVLHLHYHLIGGNNLGCFTTAVD